MVDFSELFDGEIEEFTKKAKVSCASPSGQRPPMWNKSAKVHPRISHQLLDELDGCLAW